MTPSSPPLPRPRRARKGLRLRTRWRAGMRRAVRDWKAIEEFDRRGVAIARVALLAVLWLAVVSEFDRLPRAGFILWPCVAASCALVLGFRWLFLAARTARLAAVVVGISMLVAAVYPFQILDEVSIWFLAAFAAVVGNVIILFVLNLADRQISTILLCTAGITLGVVLAGGSPGAALLVQGLVLVALYVGFTGSARGAEAQRRAARIRQQPDPTRESAEPEHSPERRRLVEDAFALVERAPSITLGLGGRRGLGKSNVLRLLLAHFAGPVRRSQPTEADLWKAKSLLPPSIGIFVRTPTTFDELNFITALHEQVALAANRAVAGILPAVQPYAVERELQHKRRLLRPMHLLGAALVLVTVACSVIPYLEAAPDDPLAGAIARWWRRSDAPSPAPMPVRGDEVVEYGQEWNAFDVDLALMAADSTLDHGVPVSDTGWARLRARHAEAAERWEAYRGATEPYRARLDTARAYEARSRAIRDSLRLIEEALFGSPSGSDARFSPSRRAMLFYSGLVGLPLLLLLAFRATREGEVRLRSRAYDPVRYVVALYERTNEVLERLRYQLSLSESAQRSAALSAGSWLKVVGINLSRSESRQVSRQARPYTVFSAAEEFRAYCRDVAFYLDEAANRPPAAGGSFRIVIAVDELDKAGDLQQLREMLKTMKAVFDIPRVAYLLSISEDALEQFRLRQVEGKDEIDSTFIHVFQVPPLDAGASAAFFLGRDVPRVLLPAAVVFSGGVPRDMHRMAQLIGVARGEHADQTGLLDYLYARDRGALRDVLRGDPCIPEEARWRWAEMVPPSWRIPPAEAAKVVEAFRAMSPELFSAASACAPDGARRTFHRVVSLFVAHMAKVRLYAEVARLPTPASVVDFTGAEPPGPELHAWLARLEALRGIFFYLESDPYGTWERLSAVAPAPAEPSGAQLA